MAGELGVGFGVNLFTNFSQNVTEPSKGISYPVSDLCRLFTKLTGPCAYTLQLGVGLGLSSFIFSLFNALFR